ncbi:hypothetical protein [Bacillus sp. FSL K6-0268]|uniref:hypothetical protein n=1 Tax=Bacillus sp. FSL K6-0268 TaxID=2921449 RepID=UPI0030F6980E
MNLMQSSSNNQLVIELEKWYSLIRKQHVKEAKKYYTSINASFSKTTSPIATLYLLFRYRYLILLEDYQNDLELNISQFDSDFKLNYYYHFFKFIHRTNTGDYQQAQYYFDNAKELLKYIDDECEIAEFNYRASLYYYYLDDPILAIHHSNSSLNLFSQYNEYEIKIAACENTLGMSYTTLEKWQLAEEYLLSSLNTFKNHNLQQCVLKVTYNLGLLYSEQNRPNLAIEHLLNSFENEKDYKTMFLLAREYYKSNNHTQALFLLQKGLPFCDKLYTQHYNILMAFIENKPLEELEDIITTAIEYLEPHRLWKDIQFYSDELAIRYLNQKNPEKSNEFFYKSYTTKKSLN